MEFSAHALSLLPALTQDVWPLPLGSPFDITDASRAGISRHTLGRLVRTGHVRQPVHGVYVDAQAPDTTELRAACLALVVPDDAVVVDRHAAWLLGTTMALAPNEHVTTMPIRVYLPPGRGRIRNGLADSGERALRPDDITRRGPLQVTTPLRTALDLGRQRYLETALAGVDAMLALGVDQEELLFEIDRFKGMRWVRTLRVVAPLGDGRAQSPPESVLRLRWIQAHLPEPVPQFEVRCPSGRLAFLDLANEDLRYAAEYDGFEWHSSPAQRAHDRERRDELSDERWDIDVFLNANLYGPRADAERRLRAGVDRCRRRPRAA